MSSELFSGHCKESIVLVMFGISGLPKQVLKNMSDVVGTGYLGYLQHSEVGEAPQSMPSRRHRPPQKI
ncbi:hypothetical protein CVT25_013903 [Psilocybe cyanescens]|uniref:Uncharacterized protein n=1 Tax=Psilocybe cyanescens TaxID=93625 RepID=A0A409XZ98_PSICY|nr:hypothetical protein CVT25_013903 [Psilocybe cyanescens]